MAPVLRRRVARVDENTAAEAVVLTHQQRYRLDKPPGRSPAKTVAIDSWNSDAR